MDINVVLRSLFSLDSVIGKLVILTPLLLFILRLRLDLESVGSF